VAHHLLPGALGDHCTGSVAAEVLGWQQRWAPPIGLDS
jgi:hypothetical protein